MGIHGKKHSLNNIEDHDPVSKEQFNVMITDDSFTGRNELATSGNWDSVYATMFSASADWEDSRNTLGSTSGNWEDSRNTLASTSGDWQDTRTTVTSTTAQATLFELSGADIITPAASANRFALFNDILLSASIGIGMKLQPGNPNFGWRDLKGSPRIRATGGTDPAFAVYNPAGSNNIRQLQFSVNDEVWIEYHIPHDYAPGTDLHIHFHWSLNQAGVSENVTWGANVLYAKGFNQQAFGGTTTNVTILQASSTTQFQHRISEVQLSTNGQINGKDIEVDGVILARVYLNANSGATEPFLHFTDIHYQSTNLPTLNKAPNFYGA